MIHLVLRVPKWEGNPAAKACHERLATVAGENSEQVEVVAPMAESKVETKAESAPRPMDENMKKKIAEDPRNALDF